jgi:hypothetical protein
VELSPVVDVPMTLNIVWSGPDGFTATNTSESYPGVITHASTIMINSFGRNESGNYICAADLRSSSTVYHVNGTAISDSIQVTTGETTIIAIMEPFYSRHPNGGSKYYSVLIIKDLSSFQRVLYQYVAGMVGPHFGVVMEGFHCIHYKTSNHCKTSVSGSKLCN